MIVLQQDLASGFLPEQPPADTVDRLFALKPRTAVRQDDMIRGKDHRIFEVGEILIRNRQPLQAVKVIADDIGIGIHGQVRWRG